jgi:hypothetical protein
MYGPRPVRKVAALIADIRWRSLSIFRTGRTGTFQTCRTLGALSRFARSGEGARISIMDWSAMRRSIRRPDT